MSSELFFVWIKRKRIKELAGIVLLAVSFLILGRMAFFCFSSDIWYDEVFSVKVLSLSYTEITEFTARDVHPPLYYWYLKCFVQAGGWLTGRLTSETVVYFAKLASLIPMAGLWLLAVTKIGRRFGLFTAGIFSFCVYTMPQLTAYGVEIRMYSLALFFITLAFLFACDIAIHKEKKACMGLLVCGILAAYTQYFSCLGIAVLYLLLGWLIRKDKALVKKWLVCIAASVLAYLPWLETLLKQLSSVRGSYWIPPLSWKSFAGCIKYIYLPSGGYPWLNYTLAILLVLATFILTIFFFRKRLEKGCLFQEEGAVLFLSWGMLGGVILIGVGVSILISPVFVYRYMIPFLGSFWLAFALLLNQCERKAVWIFTCILSLVIGYTNIKGIFWEEDYKKEHMTNTLKGLSLIEEGDILIFNFNHVQAVVGYYKDNQSYLLYQEPEELIREVYGNLDMLKEDAQLHPLLDTQEGSVWFLGSFNSREEIIQSWQSRGLKVTEEGSFLLERYWFNLYRVEK